MLTIIPNKRIGLGLLLLIMVLLVALTLPNMVSGDHATGTGAVGLVCTTDSAATPTAASFEMEAVSGYISMPDGNVIYMWGYTMHDEPFQFPGPTLCVEEGQTVTITLENTLPEAVSMVFPGQVGVSASGDGGSGLFTDEAAATTGSATYVFTAGEPGTYLYESGTAQHKQIQMGLLGALVVRPALNASAPAGTLYAYNDTSTAYSADEEFLLLLHEIDPELHQAVEGGDPYDVTTRHDRYWTINGRASPDTLMLNNVAWMPSQPLSAVVLVEAVDPDENPGHLPALIRYVNAGSVNHPFHPHGDNLKVIGQDGRFLADASITAFTRTIGGGQTFDMLFDWTNTDNWDINGETSNPIPVTLPDMIYDVVYKDDVTFYSGDPNLGETGTLPVGVTGFNACGELYFPWHSHDLQEIQNFDEGFGGMLTVVRVDPPGGCP